MKYKKSDILFSALWVIIGTVFVYSIVATGNSPMTVFSGIVLALLSFWIFVKKY